MLTSEAKGKAAVTEEMEEDDPWFAMESEAAAMMDDLKERMDRFTKLTNPTVMDENSLFDTIARCADTVSEMQAWQDTVRERPESFSITSDELQRRSMFLQGLSPTLTGAQQMRERALVAQRKRLLKSGGPVALQDDEGVGNDAFLRREHETQRAITHHDEETLDRLQSGIHRVRDTAVSINEELTTQEHILDDVDRGMTRVQMRLEGAMKKVGQLIDATSDRGKMICIAVLMVILVLLVVFVVK